MHIVYAHIDIATHDLFSKSGTARSEHPVKCYEKPPSHCCHTTLIYKLRRTTTTIANIESSALENAKWIIR